MTHPYDDIISRFKGVSAGSAELNVRIHAVVVDPQVMTDGGNWIGTVKATYEPLSSVIKNGWEDWQGFARWPEYTTSLDAKLPWEDELRWMIDVVSNECSVSVWWNNTNQDYPIHAEAATEPLARRLVALKAKVAYLTQEKVNGIVR